MNLEEYVNHPVIKEKYNEYSAGADYLVGYGLALKNYHYRPFETFSHSGIDNACSMALDMFRSYSDKGSALIILDVERYSHRFKNSFCEDQAKTYYSIENFNRCILDVFSEFNITPLVIATGQGYHYAMRVDKGKYEYELLEKIGESGLDSDLANSYIDGRIYKGRRTLLSDGAAFIGAGKLLEYVANKILRRASYYGVNVPIHIGDVFTHNNDNEGINIDLSCFEAPIHMRDIRCPFTTHQKQQVKSDGNKYTPIRVAIPRLVPAYNDLIGNGFELPLNDLFRIRENYWDAHNFAKNVSMEIPEQAWGISNLANEYLKSELFEFHDIFDKSNPNFINFDFNSSDWLSPTTIKSFVDSKYNGNPIRAKQMAFYVADKYKSQEWMKFDFNKYPAYPKAKFWIRANAGLWHGNA